MQRRHHRRDVYIDQLVRQPQLFHRAGLIRCSNHGSGYPLLRKVASQLQLDFLSITQARLVAQVNEGSFSATAFGTAVMRARHQSENPRILSDPIVGRLLTVIPPPAPPAGLGGNVPERLGNLKPSVFVVRSRYAEDELALAAERGVRQYVILGAGLETFAFRQPDYGVHLTIYEVDHPLTQQWKREALGRAGIQVPANTRWAALNFEQQTLGQGLAVAGFDPTRPAFFSWLGVTQYLTPAAINATLAFVGALPKGTTIVLTFVLPDSELRGDDLATAVGSARVAAAFGEPWLTRFHPEQIIEVARSLGFSEIEHLTPAAVTERYFADRDDSLQAVGHEQLLRLSV